MNKQHLNIQESAVVVFEAARKARCSLEAVNNAAFLLKTAGKKSGDGHTN